MKYSLLSVRLWKGAAEDVKVTESNGMCTGDKDVQRARGLACSGTRRLGV